VSNSSFTVKVMDAPPPEKLTVFEAAARCCCLPHCVYADHSDGLTGSG